MCGIKLNEEQRKFIHENNLNNFKDTEIYQTFEKDKGKINISKLYGNNGEINKKELENFYKFNIKISQKY